MNLTTMNLHTARRITAQRLCINGSVAPMPPGSTKPGAPIRPRGRAARKQNLLSSSDSGATR